MQEMNPKLTIAATVCLALFVAGCGLGGTPSLIIGKWEVENAPLKMTAEFNGDGTAKMTILGQTLQGRYKLNGGDELEWTMNGMSTRAKINVTATELELTNDQKETIKYRRK